ncbi:MAG: hypothetical protein LV481_10130 [Methylacidiphilales bacterium]|nr:hypothetical protein [Candidatus Methylacidiphilales bacterium]
MIFADAAIFPVFTTPYLIIRFIPWVVPLVLIVEGIVFWRFYPAMKRWMLIAGIIGANVFSWVVGLLLVGFLPRGYSIDPDTHAIHFVQSYILLSFIIALILAIILEYAFWRLISWKSPLPSLGRANAYANLASYALLILVAILFALT